MSDTAPAILTLVDSFDRVDVDPTVSPPRASIVKDGTEAGRLVANANGLRIMQPDGHSLLIYVPDGTAWHPFSIHPGGPQRPLGPPPPPHRKRPDMTTDPEVIFTLPADDVMAFTATLTPRTRRLVTWVAPILDRLHTLGAGHLTITLDVFHRGTPSIALCVVDPDNPADVAWIDPDHDHDDFVWVVTRHGSLRCYTTDDVANELVAALIFT